MRLTPLIEVGMRVPLACTQGLYRESEAAQARILPAHPAGLSGESGVGVATVRLELGLGGSDQPAR